MTTTPQPDFLRPARGRGLLPWLACATALLVLALAGLDAQHARQQRDDAAAGRLRAGAPPTPAAAAPRVATSATTSAAGGRPAQVGQAAPAAPAAQAAPAAAAAQSNPAQRALQQAAQRLARPWAAAFAALDAIDSTGIVWLGLNVGEGGSLRLQGQAGDSRAPMAAAAALRRQGPWPDALPGRIDNAADGANASGSLRFEISAEAPR